MENLETLGVMNLKQSEIENIDGCFLITAGAIFLSALIIGGPILGWASGHTAIGQPVKR